MKIVNYEPPQWIYEECREKFGADFYRGTIFTYGSNIHVAGGAISDDLLVHESTHIRQQAIFPGGPDAWWKRYLSDSEFRISQELEAYKAQFEFVCKAYRIKGRQGRFNAAKPFAELLSSPLYGKGIGIYEALRLITNGK